jgi:hypothetical protein
MKKALLLALLASPIGLVACGTSGDSVPPAEATSATAVSFEISGMT